MPDPEDINPEGTPPATPPADGDSKGGSTSVVDWEKRYKGLQKTFDALTNKFNKLQEQYDQLVAESEELRQKTKGHEAEKTALSNSLHQKETENDTLSKQIAAHALERERTKLIMTEYPDLAQFEAKGLLPSAETVEALKPLLDEFRGTIKGMVGDNVNQKLKGSTPQGGGNHQPPARDKETVYNEMVALAGSRDAESQRKFLQLRDEWDAMNQ